MGSVFWGLGQGIGAFFVLCLFWFLFYLVSFFGFFLVMEVCNDWPKRLVGRQDDDDD
jgi:hypothetical protein